VVAVNLSLGGGHAGAPTLSRLSDEFAALDALGILSIVAAGNGGLDEGPGVSVLASDPSVIGVSAVDGRGAFAGFSQRHPELTDIAAPGTGITIETLDGVLLSLVGTSFAAPLVAGAVAVVQEAAQAVTGARLPPDEVLGILRESGEPVAGTGPDAPPGYRIAHAEAAAAHVIESFPDEPDTILF
jgi:subtilisin family serine protease